MSEKDSMVNSFILAVKQENISAAEFMLNNKLINLDIDIFDIILKENKSNNKKIDEKLIKLLFEKGFRLDPAKEDDMLKYYSKDIIKTSSIKDPLLYDVIFNILKSENEEDIINLIKDLDVSFFDKQVKDAFYNFKRDLWKDYSDTYTIREENSYAFSIYRHDFYNTIWMFAIKRMKNYNVIKYLIEEKKVNMYKEVEFYDDLKGCITDKKLNVFDILKYAVNDLPSGTLEECEKVIETIINKFLSDQSLNLLKIKNIKYKKYLEENSKLFISFIEFIKYYNRTFSFHEELKLKVSFEEVSD